MEIGICRAGIFSVSLKSGKDYLVWVACNDFFCKPDRLSVCATECKTVNDHFVFFLKEEVIN